MIKNIISKLTFDDIADNTNLPVTYKDNNKYSSLIWNTYSTAKITHSNNVNVLNITSVNIRILSNIFTTDKQFMNNDFELDINISFNTLNSNNNFFGITSSGSNWIYFNVRNTFIGGLSIVSSANKSMQFNYKFESNKDYNIIVSSIDNKYRLIINGETIGFIDSSLFISSLPANTNVMAVVGSGNNITSQNDNMANGKIWNVNISYGAGVKNEDSTHLTKYGSNLLSRLNFDNIQQATSVNIFTPSLEALINSKVNWEYDNSKLTDYYVNTNFKTNISTDFTLLLKMSNNRKNIDTKLIEYGNYKVIYNYIGVPEPEVIVTDKTTSALDFEDGIVDQVGTTIWQKEGTANVTSVNKIFGTNSFETKALGDSLYTNNNVITGGDTPFTIEFYALLKGENHGSETGTQYPLLQKSNNTMHGHQLFNIVSSELLSYRIGNNMPNSSTASTTYMGSYKNKLNEINKYTITYDGSALRCFINDKLDILVGRNNGFYPTTSLPLTFFREYITRAQTYYKQTYGIIDNINIHDGIATKVRNPDPYKEFLVVDLAFDGENNSTKIVDNGTLKSSWTVNGNAKISTDQKFGGFSSLYIDSGGMSRISSNLSLNLIKDFTISFEFIKENDVGAAFFDTRAETRDYTNAILITFPSVDSNSINVYMNGLGNDWNVSLNSGTFIELNKKYKVNIICKSNNLQIYVDGILKASNQYDFDVFMDIDSRYSTIGKNINGGGGVLQCYIKNFKIYKDVAVIPEDPTGKIQLDFDNNVNDKYGNSTWTNNDVTFDQVNSVKGHAAKFNGSNSILSISNNQNLNFENKNFVLSYDFKNAIFDSVNNRYLLGNGMALAQGAFWRLFGTASSKSGSVNLNYNSTNYGLTNTVEVENNYYNEKILRNSDTLVGFKNDVAISALNVINTFNVDFKNMSIGTASSLTGSVSYFNGYLDNFKSIKDYQENVIIDKPAVHLPLETNAINTGFTPLTINSVGNPTYTTIDGKKCIKFESGKYLTINSNNIFNLGTSSDFYIEMRIYVNNYTLPNRIFASTLNSDNSRIGLGSTLSNYYKKLYINAKDFSDYPSINECLIDHWNDIKIYRKNQKLTIFLNGVISEYDVNQKEFDFSSTCIGGLPTTYFDGYMSNFKMFVGTSEIPESYNDKKVLDLDFKPTRKSYLFKDNNNKCVIHPVNITQRDYQDSQYCCSFNGVDQYLQLGKNELFNFGNDDFVINIKFKFQKRSNNLPILSSGETSNVAGYWYLQVRSETASTNPLKVEFTYRIDSSNFYTIMHNIELVENVIYDLILIREGSTMTLSVNGIIDFSITGVPNPSVFNLNTKDNTCVGINKYNPIDWIFKGKIYSLKVLRNTTDLSLLEDELDVFNESFKLTNGDETLDQVITNDKKVESHDVRFIKDEESTKLIVDGEFVEVPNVENTTDDLILFDNYNGKVSDIKLYDKSFIDEDIFLGNDPIDTEFGEVEYADDEMELFLPEGEFNLIGFIEGYTDRKFSIYNTFYKYELYEGIEDYNITGLDEYSLDDYEIFDSVSGEKYKVLTHEMIKGFISGTVNLKNCGVTSNNMEVFCYRSDNHRLIGTYSVSNEGKYLIPNLDVNSRYDIIFKDITRKINDQISNYRKPMMY